MIIYMYIFSQTPKSATEVSYK